MASPGSENDENYYPDYSANKDAIKDHEKSGQEMQETLARLAAAGVTAKLGVDGSHTIAMTSNVTCPQVATGATTIFAR